MDLTTKYLGMELRTPLVPSASPLSDGISNIRRMEDEGAAAVVLYSLFEEQLALEEDELQFQLTQGSESFAEALSYFPELDDYNTGPAPYLRLISVAKKVIPVPVIGVGAACEAGGRAWAGGR